MNIIITKGLELHINDVKDDIFGSSRSYSKTINDVDIEKAELNGASIRFHNGT